MYDSTSIFLALQSFIPIQWINGYFIIKSEKIIFFSREMLIHTRPVYLFWICFLFLQIITKRCIPSLYSFNKFFFILPRNFLKHCFVSFCLCPKFFWSCILVIVTFHGAIACLIFAHQHLINNNNDDLKKQCSKNKKQNKFVFLFFSWFFRQIRFIWIDNNNEISHDIKKKIRIVEDDAPFLFHMCVCV